MLDKVARTWEVQFSVWNILKGFMVVALCWWQNLHPATRNVAIYYLRNKLIAKNVTALWYHWKMCGHNSPDERILCHQWIFMTFYTSPTTIISFNMPAWFRNDDSRTIAKFNKNLFCAITSGNTRSKWNMATMEFNYSKASQQQVFFHYRTN